METFKTGQPAPSTDMYSFAGIMIITALASPMRKTKKVPMIAGENFPACRQCGNNVYWTT